MSRFQPDREPSLVQTRLGRGDRWRVGVICIMLNLTQWYRAEPVIEEIFERWPTPRSLADADLHELRELIAPLGLSIVRSDRLKRFSQDVEDGMVPEWGTGIGKYGRDAMALLCAGQIDQPDVRDRALRTWQRWALQTAEKLNKPRYDPVGR